MKKKILATFMACLTLTVGALAFSACDGDNGDNDNEDTPAVNIQVTENDWHTEITKFKGFDGLKSYTIDAVASFKDGDAVTDISTTVYVSRENGQYYAPQNKQLISEDTYNLVYFKMGNSYQIGEDKTHTVCDCLKLDYYSNGLKLTKINCLDYEDAEKLFMQSCGLTMLENIRYNDEIIKLENAYEKFTYNEETKTYSASAEILMSYIISGLVDDEFLANPNYYKDFEISEYYTLYEIEVAFQKNSFIMTMKTDDELPDCTLRIYGFNDTQITLDEEDVAALNK